MNKESWGFGGLVTVLLLFLYSSYRGHLSNAFVSSVATSLLVVITAWYAVTTRKLLDQTQKEQRRIHIKSLIADGIDEISESLHKNKDEIEEESPLGAQRLPHLHPALVRDSVATDLKERHLAEMKQFELFSELRRDYEELWREVRDQIATEIQEDSLPENSPPTLEGLLAEEIREHEEKIAVDLDQDLKEYIRDRSEKMALLTLYNSPPPEVKEDYAIQESYCDSLILDRYRTEFLDLRKQESFREDIEELETHLDDLDAACNTLIN